MTQQIETVLINNIPTILRMVGDRLDKRTQMSVRNALFAMAGELSSERTIEISEEQGAARIEGLLHASKAIEDKLAALPDSQRDSDPAKQLALCGHAIGEIRDSFTLALQEGLTAKVNVHRLAESIKEDREGPPEE